MKREDLDFTYDPVQKVEYARLYDIDDFQVYLFLYNFLCWSVNYDIAGFQLLNGDEVGVGGPKTANSAPAKAMHPKNSTRPNEYATGRSTGRITLMMWTAASGFMPSPWVLLTQASSDHYLNEALIQTGCVAIYNTSKGYMTAEMFEANLSAFINHYRTSYLQPRGFTEWQTMQLLILLDGASSHKLSAEALASPAYANVDFLYLPAHASHIFQTIHVCLARMVKKDLNMAPRPRINWQGEEETIKSRPAADLLFALESGLKQASTRDAGVSAWKTTGLFPWDPSQIDNRNQLPEEIREVIRSLVGLTKEECIMELTHHLLRLTDGDPAPRLEGLVSGNFMTASASPSRTTARIPLRQKGKGKASKK